MYRCGECELDVENRRFSRGDREIVLEPKVFDVLARLVMHPGELLTRDQLLDAVWGHRYVTPSTLNRAIVLARRAFSQDTDGSTYIQTVHGSGYRYVGPIEQHLPAAAPEPRAQFAPPLTARVPSRLDEIIGRETEITQLDEMLRVHRGVTLLGAGGMGKTQCAFEFARRSVAQYPDGVWFYDLAPMQQAIEWLESLALSLAISPKNEPHLIAKVASVLASRQALLLLDNCDRISVDVGAFVVEILRTTDKLRVLATSQQQLNFVGEQVMRIPPLSLPDADLEPNERNLPQIAAASAVALLVTRASAVQRAFTLTTRNASQVVEICRRLDGMPLALELAAVRFALLDPEQILNRLDHRFRFLVSDLAGRDSRHRTLHALIDWSYGLLSGEEQQLLCWLGVFLQGWTMEVAGSLASALGKDADTIVELLTGLVKKSLVVVDPTLNPPRYRLLESVRSFALEQLAVRGEEVRARDAHLKCIHELAQRAQTDMRSGRMRERNAQLALEHPNISAAIEYATGNCRHRESALGIVGALMLYIKSRGVYVEGRVWCETALANADDLESPAYARAWLTLGVIDFHLNNSRAAEEQSLIKALELARLTDDTWALACGSGFRALDLANKGQAERAVELLQQARQWIDGLQDDWLRGVAGLAQGWIHLARGKWKDAIQSLQAVQHLGYDFHQKHFIETYIALCLFALGEYEKAAARWREALHRAVEVRNIRGASGSVEGCSYIAAQNGNAAQAIRFLSMAETIRSRSKCPLFRFWNAHHDAAMARVKAALPPDQFAQLCAAGAAAREEDVMNEALAALEAFAAPASRSDADRPASP